MEETDMAVDINEQHTQEMKKLGELIEGIEVAMLTTHASDGSMVSRPLQTLQFDHAGELAFFTAADSGKLEEIAAASDVNIAYANPSKQTYVSIRGTATVDHDAATIEKLWSEPQRIFFKQGKDDPNLIVLRVRVRDAAYWESAGNVLARSLDFAKAYLSKDPQDLGEQGHLRGSNGAPSLE